MRKRYSLSLIVLSLILSILFTCTPQPEQETLSADNIVISYHVEGEGNPALIFVHGWSCDKGYWKNQVAHFSILAPPFPRIATPANLSRCRKRSGYP